MTKAEVEARIGLIEGKKTGRKIISKRQKNKGKSPSPKAP